MHDALADLVAEPMAPGQLLNCVVGVSNVVALLVLTHAQEESAAAELTRGLVARSAGASAPDVFAGPGLNSCTLTPRPSSAGRSVRPTTCRAKWTAPAGGAGGLRRRSGGARRSGGHPALSARPRLDRCSRGDVAECRNGSTRWLPHDRSRCGGRRRCRRGARRVWFRRYLAVAAGRRSATAGDGDSAAGCDPFPSGPGSAPASTSRFRNAGRACRSRRRASRSSG